MTSAQTDELLPANTTPEARGQAAARAYLFHLEQARQARRQAVVDTLAIAASIVMVLGLFLAAWIVF